MPAERFFIDQTLTEHVEIVLEDDEAFHLTRVMRARIGDTIEITNGKGELAQATISAILKKGVKLEVGPVHKEPVPTPSLILCIGLPRFNRLEFIIEKATELGVHEFWLFPGEYSEKTNLTDHQKERLRHLAIAAIKQCGRLDLPVIELKPKLSIWTKPKGTLLFGDTHPDAPLIGTYPNRPVLFFSGPERGFTSHEVEILHKWDALGVSLHRNILRADTAPIAAAAILSLF